MFFCCSSSLKMREGHMDPHFFSLAGSTHLGAAGGRVLCDHLGGKEGGCVRAPHWRRSHHAAGGLTSTEKLTIGPLLTP